MHETDFEAWLRAALGEIPGLALDLGPLAAIGPTAWASPGVTGPLPIVPAFREETGDYALAGQWGRGGASEALYVVERHGPHRAFLRLPWPGGPYGDAARDRERIGEALLAWTAFRRTARERLAGSEVVSNMQSDRATLEWPDGRTEELLGPTPLDPDRAPFWAALVHAVGG